MAQKRRQYVKTSTGIEEQLIASSADIVAVDDTTLKLGVDNVQEALEKLGEIAATGGVTSVNGQTGAVELNNTHIGLNNVTNDAQVKRSEMGVAGGVATLDTDGKVPSSQLPAYVDEVIEGTLTNDTTFAPTNNEDSVHLAKGGKIYVDVNTKKTYRWSGSQYVEISASLAIGTTSGTAYDGLAGATNAGNIATLQGEMKTVNTDISNIKNGTTTVGKAESANKLAAGKKISLSGDATGETTFDGSEDKAITVTLANSGVAAGTYSAVQVDAKGRVTAGAQIIEWGISGQSEPSANLAEGGLFFEMIE